MAKKVVAVPAAGKKTVENGKTTAKKEVVAARSNQIVNDDDDEDEDDEAMDDEEDDDDDEDGDDDEDEEDDEEMEMDDDEEDADDEGENEEEAVASSSSSHEDVIDDLNYDVRNLATFNYHPIRLQGNSAVDEAIVLEAATRATQLLVKRYAYYCILFIYYQDWMAAITILCYTFSHSYIHSHHLFLLLITQHTL